MNLKNVNHINQFKKLRLPLNKVLIVGSGTLALLGLKENDDIDLWVTEDLYKKLDKHKDLKSSMKFGRLFYETKDGNIEMSKDMPCNKRKVEYYLKRAIVVDGVHFKSVDDVISWKKCMGRPKDLQDIKILENYKKKNVVEYYLSII